MKLPRAITLVSIIIGILLLAACDKLPQLLPTAAVFTFTSNHEHDGEAILCSNETNIITYSFTATRGASSIRSWTETYYGVDSGQQYETTRYPSDAKISHSTFTVTSSSSSGILPAGSVTTSGINVVPVNPQEGTTSLTITVRNVNGETSSATHLFSVYDCTPPIIADDFVFESSYTLNGQPVVCDNQTTTIEYSFRTSNPANILRWDETYVGKYSGQRKTVTNSSLPNQGTIRGDRVNVNPTIYTPGNQFLPLSIAPAAIIVVPINPDPTSHIGTTELTVEVFSRDGKTTGTGFIELPIYGNCPAS